MGVAERLERRLTVEEFLTTDPTSFGNAWRYELIDGLPVGQAAPSPEHGAIMSNLSTALNLALRENPDCRPEDATAAVPRNKRNDRARIPDVMVRCNGKPVVLFEIVSPSEEKSPRERNEKRRDLMNVDGVLEIIEIAQNDFACQIYRKSGDLWAYDSAEGAESVVRLESLGVDIPLAELYRKVLPVPDTAPPQG
jgi:Uma2 family endonuclease